MLLFLGDNNVASPESFYQWLYESEYTKKNLITHILYFDEKAIGFGSIQFFPLENIKIGSMVNLYIEGHHRTLGPALILEKALLNDPASAGSCDYFLAKPNAMADIVFKRLDFTKLGHMRRFTLIINPVYYLKLPSWVFNPVSKLIAAFLRFNIFITLQSTRLKKGTCFSRQAELVADVKGYLKNYSDFHYWRYIESEKTDIQVCRFYEVGKKDSFILFHIHDFVLSIDDIRDVENECMESLLTDFIFLMSKKYKIRNISLSVLTGNKFLEILSNLGFIERRDGTEQTIYARNGNLQGKVKLHALMDYLIFPTNLDF
jgi:hypothetical protein